MEKNRKAEVEGEQKNLDLKNKKYQLELDTSAGKVLLDLWSDVAPGHVANILGLAKIGYYDGLIFHRIIKGFMIQGGCPEGTGTGGPGYTIKAEFNNKKHEPGVLSAARTSDPHSAGAQFFICLGSHPHLDGQYTAFGKTADAASLQAVKNIGDVSTDRNDRPLKPVSIKTARVLESAKS
ncbi:MAG TPA: peptidylprolyl isomerase [Pirellulales bacterium]|jgi:cyclophilin family peptidyl-prolyl cis-trans isomerase|nr:peptidylprolyl isomerase [Pirellulales bacterium]